MHREATLIYIMTYLSIQFVNILADVFTSLKDYYKVDKRKYVGKSRYGKSYWRFYIDMPCLLRSTYAQI